MRTVSHATDTYIADSELAALLATARETGARVRVKAGDETYELDVHVSPERQDPFKTYDAARLRARLRSLETNPIFTEEEAENLKSLIYEARERGTRPLDRP
jgi:hypothetical protein